MYCILELRQRSCRRCRGNASAVVQLARYIESANRLGRVYCSDTEFATVPIKNGKKIKLIPVELAVYDLDEEVVTDTPIKYDESVEKFLADAPRTGPTTRFSRGVMRRIYGEGPQTRRMKIDDIRDILFDAGMNANSDLVEWSINGIDRQIMGTIMAENIPINSICLVNHWKRVLPGFLTMRYHTSTNSSVRTQPSINGLHRAGRLSSCSLIQ